MVIFSWQKKLNYITTALPKAVVKEIEGDIFVILAREFSDLEMSVRKTLVFELIYVFTRYFHWIESQAFQALTGQFLEFDFQLNSERIPFLLQPLTEKFALVDNSQQVKRLNHNQDFLRAILLNSLGLDEETAEWELGFGSELLNSLKRAAGDGDLRHSMESELRLVISQLSQEFSDCPWQLDLYRCDYKILRTTSEIASMLEANSIFWIFSALLEVGKGVVRTKKKLAQSMCENSRVEVSTLLLDELIEFLQLKGFLFASGTNISLTENSFALTALYYALHCERPRDTNTFLQLHSLWQMELTRQKSIEDLLVELLESQAPLHPLVLHEGIRRLREHMPRAKLHAFCKYYLEYGLTPEVRIAAGYCLKDAFKNEAESQELWALLQKENSALVQNSMLDFALTANRKLANIHIAHHIESLPRRICEHVL